MCTVLIAVLAAAEIAIPLASRAMYPQSTWATMPAVSPIGLLGLSTALVYQPSSSIIK